MQVYITADMEGVTGLVRSSEVCANQCDYEEARSLMAADVNAAIAGAFAGGATAVVVNDAHWQMANIRPRELDPRAQLLRGRTMMTEGLTADFAAYFQVGMHAMVGKGPGVMNETILGREIHGLRLNGRDIGEIGLNAAYAGALGVPFCLATGDDWACAEARALVNNLEVVAVKMAVGRWAARCLSPEVTGELIYAAAQRAVEKCKLIPPYTVQGPYTFEIIWNSTAEAAAASLIPGVKVDKVDFRINRLTGSEYLEVYQLCRTAILLGATAADEIYG